VRRLLRRDSAIGFVTDVTRRGCRNARRKAQVTRPVNAGCSNEQIKAITGHRSDSSLAVYKRGGNQRLLARQALQMQLGAKGEQKLSNHPTRLDKTGSK